MQQPANEERNEVQAFAAKPKVVKVASKYREEVVTT